MLVERREQQPATRPFHARSALAGLAVGIIPAALMLAVLMGAVPPAVSLQTEAIAFVLYFVSLPVAAILIRRGPQSATAGFAIGVLLTTGVVILTMVIAAAHAVAAGGY